MWRYYTNVAIENSTESILNTRVALIGYYARPEKPLEKTVSECAHNSNPRYTNKYRNILQSGERLKLGNFNGSPTISRDLTPHCGSPGPIFKWPNTILSVPGNLHRRISVVPPAFLSVLPSAFIETDGCKFSSENFGVSCQSGQCILRMPLKLLFLAWTPRIPFVDSR